MNNISISKIKQNSMLLVTLLQELKKGYPLGRPPIECDDDLENELKESFNQYYEEKIERFTKICADPTYYCRNYRDWETEFHNILLDTLTSDSNTEILIRQTFGDLFNEDDTIFDILNKLNI